MSPTSYQTALPRDITTLMPGTGIEPVRSFKDRRILSPVRLPVPPPRLIFFFGSWGGARTHNLPVNSRLLRH